MSRVGGGGSGDGGGGGVAGGGRVTQSHAARDVDGDGDVVLWEQREA